MFIRGQLCSSCPVFPLDRRSHSGGKNPATQTTRPTAFGWTCRGQYSISRGLEQHNPRMITGFIRLARKLVNGQKTDARFKLSPLRDGTNTYKIQAMYSYFINWICLAYLTIPTPLVQATNVRFGMLLLSSLTPV